MSFEYMSPSEKAAYLKGLAEGLDLDKSKPEGKLIDAMLELLYDITDELNAVEERVDDIEDEFYDDIDDEDFDEEYYDFDEENPDYEVMCPDCGAEVVVDEDTLIEGEINCPNCGGVLEFDFSSLFDPDKEESDDLPF